jgi:hypothetical protein
MKETLKPVEKGASPVSGGFITRISFSFLVHHAKPCAVNPDFPPWDSVTPLQVTTDRPAVSSMPPATRDVVHQPDVMLAGIEDVIHHTFARSMSYSTSSLYWRDIVSLL